MLASRRFAALSLIFSLAGCPGGGAAGAGGTAGMAGSGGAGGSSGGSSGGGDGGSTGGAGGDAGAGGTSGGQGGTGGTNNCPDIDCGPLVCPAGLWKDAMGCDTCACAPPDVAMSVSGQSFPVTKQDMTTKVSLLIGGINRWVFDFDWSYDGGPDNGHQIQAQLKVMDVPNFPIDASNQTWFLPDDLGMPLEQGPAIYTLYGFGVISGDLVETSGFLSIRKNGQNFEGGVSLDFTPVGMFPGPPVHAAGPFSVPIPP